MAKQLPANPTYFLVPAGTRMSICRGTSLGGCCAAAIYFVENPKTKKLIPIDCDVPDGIRPGPAVDPSQVDLLSGEAGKPQDGRGVSHYLTCPDADLFTRKR